jgi:hypothetical protein
MIVTLAVLSAASLFFVLNGVWLNPLVPTLGAASAGHVSLILALVFKSQYKALFLRAYEAALPEKTLAALIRRGKMPIKAKGGKVQLKTTAAALVAIRYPGLSAAELRENDEKNLVKIAEEKSAFRSAASHYFKEMGAAIVGVESELVIAAFGSPATNETKGAQTNKPTEEALKAVEQCIKAGKRWSFGVDFGQCCFVLNPAPGESQSYQASGPSQARARILSGLAQQYAAPVLISRTVHDLSEGHLTRKIASLANKEGGEPDVFFELIV